MGAGRPGVVADSTGRAKLTADPLHRLRATVLGAVAHSPARSRVSPRPEEPPPPPGGGHRPARPGSRPPSQRRRSSRPLEPRACARAGAAITLLPTEVTPARRPTIDVNRASSHAPWVRRCLHVCSVRRRTCSRACGASAVVFDMLREVPDGWSTRETPSPPSRGSKSQQPGWNLTDRLAGTTAGWGGDASPGSYPVPLGVNQWKGDPPAQDL